MDGCLFGLVALVDFQAPRAEKLGLRPSKSLWLEASVAIAVARVSRVSDQEVALARLGVETVHSDVLAVMVNVALVVAVHAHNRVKLIHQSLDATCAFARADLDVLARLEVAVRARVQASLVNEFDQCRVTFVHAENRARGRSTHGYEGGTGQGVAAVTTLNRRLVVVGAVHQKSVDLGRDDSVNDFSASRSRAFAEGAVC